ncbi:MAG: cytochrome c3 family protein [Deltaproteobacteria bacterium]|nr:cytochrome c3 family protein [Deltaproteobacteria bacterium]
MDLKKEKFIAYCAVAALFVIGVVCYAAFPDKRPDEPVRVMFNSAPGATGGKVLFTHKDHATLINYGIDCVDCHHKWVKEESEKPAACRECHPVEKAEGDDPKQPKRSDALHTRCGGCHDDAGHGPGTKDCSGCHVL